MRGIQFSGANETTLMTADELGTICIWDTPNSEWARRPSLIPRLCIESTPSQVIYSSQEAPTLTAVWVDPISAVATGQADGTIRLYRVEPSRASSRFVNGAVRATEEGRRGANGLFDELPKEPWACVWRLTRRVSVMCDHSDAVWSLFSNGRAGPGCSRWLFSASASGCMKGYDLESGGRV